MSRRNGKPDLTRRFRTGWSVYGPPKVALELGIPLSELWKKTVSIKEYARKNNLSESGVIHRIRSGRVRALRSFNRWWVVESELKR